MKINPRKHLELLSEGGSFKLLTPLVIDEHQETSITLLVLGPATRKESPTKIQITASGPLMIRNGGKWCRLLNRSIAMGGNDTIRVNTTSDFRPPSGMEGDCVVPGTIAGRSIDEEGVILDSIGFDVLIRRRIINVFSSVWKSSGEIAKFIVTSGAAALIAGFVSMIFGLNISEILLTSLGVATIAILLVSFAHSWFTRERFIKRRLKENRHYARLIGEEVSN